jgi:hypothetical protein
VLILPRHELRVLHAKPRHEWREPSQRRTLGGIENRTWFSVLARTSDGVRYWRGWFESWDDADAFLWALTLQQCEGRPIEPEIRRLPRSSGYPHTFLEQAWRPALYEGEWRPEWRDLPLIYEKLAVTSFLTSPTGSNQTWTSPADWDNADNSIECIGAGASGGHRGNTTGTGSGGGAGAYGKALDHTVSSPGTDTRTYQIGTGGTGVAASTNGNPGTSTWFNDTAFPTAVTDNTKASGQRGLNGVQGSGAQNGGPGGAAASGSGSTRNDGGAGGDGNSTGGHGCGGGGAGGTTAAGLQPTLANGNVSTPGGAGGTANGGTAGAASDGLGGAGGNGGTGTVWDASHGAGGGGGGCRNGTGSNGGGAGGLYGGGGGGCGSQSVGNTGAGAQGIIVVIYTPLITTPRKVYDYRRRRV